MKITNEHVRCIRERGYVVIDKFLGKTLSESLRNEIATYGLACNFSIPPPRFKMLTHTYTIKTG